MYLVGPFHHVSFLRNMAAKWLPGITLVGSARGTARPVYYVGHMRFPVTAMAFSTCNRRSLRNRSGQLQC